MQDVLNITFAIICYNYGRYLRRAIESCLIQKAPDVETEVLVLDDGSTDETPAICTKYQGRIRTSRSENLGLGATLTRAVQESRGEWVFFLDADDYFAPAKLEAFLPYLRSEFLLVNDRMHFADQKGRLCASITAEGGATSTLAIHRRSARSLLPVENEHYFHILGCSGKKAEVPRACTFHRIHDTNLSKQHSPGVRNAYLASLTHRLADRLESMSSSPPEWFSSKACKSLAWHYRSQAWYYELATALECKLFTRACGRWLRMVTAANRSGKGLKKIHWEMLIKTILMRDDFRR
ncbi:MAG: hypothetical protein C5B47_05245 [Verrucomicrobia bacterium]|nr:MAG: hypothetical protein C5B47_05245 [Verrucomicrobiota bacterium]